MQFEQKVKSILVDNVMCFAYTALGYFLTDMVHVAIP